MRAASFAQPGPAREVIELGDVSRPTPGKGDVLVEVATSGVNPSDVAQRSGAFLYPKGETYPIIPHSDGAGTIIAVGAGVLSSRIGERVWLWNARWGRQNGTAAEFVALPEAQAVRLPDNVSFEDAAAFGIPLLTAWRAVTMNGPVLGQTLLVTGGAGAVASYAIQLAKIGGATVIATGSGPEKAARATEMGADHVIDYRREDVAARALALTGGHGVDLAIDLEAAANSPVLPAAVRPLGTIVIYGARGATTAFPAVDMIVKSLSVRFFIVYELPADVRAAAIAQLTTLLAAGRLKTPIDEVFPLDRIVEAHERVEQGRAVGNVIIKIR